MPTETTIDSRRSRRKTVRLHDVARMAGVSAATVSRILTGSGNSMPETIAAVEQAAAKLGYVVPNIAAGHREQLPPGMKYGQIAFVVPDYRAEASNTPFSMAMLKGAGDACNECGINLALVHSNEDGSISPLPGPNRVDGLILKNWPDDERVVAKLPKLPTVFCLDTPGQNHACDQVQFDIDALACKIMRYFHERGVKRVAALTDMAQLTQEHAVERVYEVARKAGFEASMIAPEIASHAVATSEMITSLLNLEPLPEIVFCFGSSALLPSLQMACNARDIRLGEDLEIVPETLQNHLSPELHARRRVHFPLQELGEAAADMLLWRLAHPNAAQRRTLLAPRLIDVDDE